MKTRLSPPLSAEETLVLHERLTLQTLRSAHALVATGEASVEVSIDAGSATAARRWLGYRDIAYRRQGEGDLGARIGETFARAFGRGAQRVLVIGSDCPRLSAVHLREAFERLSDADLVLGPATDGGYYLIGLNHEPAARALPAILSEVPWGTGDVLARTLDLAQSAQLRTVLLERLPDVDRPEDLQDAERALARGRLTGDSTVSVVIPTLNDAELVAAAVASARAEGAAEILVVDGGSDDATCAVAAAAGARVLKSAARRARQMNNGAAAASGDVLLFLHADTVLPKGACSLAARALADPLTVAGGFSFEVPAHARHSALISRVGRLRSRLGGLPWGDQALFVARSTFRELGGFPDQPTMEDYEFAERLGRLGRVVTLPERATTSARSWEDHGLLVPTLTNLAVIAMYEIGADPARISAWRRRIAR
ncbi:MAG: TIGR04283 family arsenosugar biosynthesis glycosyltransferase [Coriobacteriia bacterium]|nr:TIGR04283 family arsenosugar biosynthesis glycosyltransferase [Coriobacteriia bacterium]